jgi:hypothetical protein
LILGLGMTLASCTDDDDEKDSEVVVVEGDPYQKTGDVASVLFVVMNQLADVDSLPDNWQTATFEPTIGTPLDGNTTIRVVNCGSMQTTVLGTAFNVRNFETEPTEVMLLKGTVSVSTARGDSLLLVPGRAASLGSDGTLSVSDADADVVTSWMRGEFYFDGQTLREIMIAIGRWYNKSVVFSGTQHLDDRLHFSSERTLPLSEIIRQLNDISNVQIAIEDDVLRVY